MNPETLTELRAACAGEAREGGPKNFVRLFKPQFAELVRTGAKTQTIRPLPKRIPRRGDTLSLRQWSGKPYRSPQIILATAQVEEIKVCRIQEDGIFMQAPQGSLMAAAGVEIISLTGSTADHFARADGFQDWNEMREWFKTEHGLPFDGVVLYWS